MSGSSSRSSSGRLSVSSSWDLALVVGGVGSLWRFQADTPRPDTCTGVHGGRNGRDRRGLQCGLRVRRLALPHQTLAIRRAHHRRRDAAARMQSLVWQDTLPNLFVPSILQRGQRQLRRLGSSHPRLGFSPGQLDRRTAVMGLPGLRIGCLLVHGAGLEGDGRNRSNAGHRWASSAS